MKMFKLIGCPLGHSMSPLIHKALFEISGAVSDYTLAEIKPENLEASVNDLKKLSGFNVTIPHKTSIIPYLDKLSKKAQLFGAVNTVHCENGSMTGYNTDCTGFLKALESAQIPLKGKVLVCGSGGVSRMFAFESVLAGADLTLAVRERGLPKAMRIKDEIKEKLNKDISVTALNGVSAEFDVLINGTPVGMYPSTGECVLTENQIAKCGAVFDAIYNPLETKLIQHAKKSGAKYLNGLPMLVWQAAAAQEIWLDYKFSTHDIEKVIQITEREMKKL